MSQHEMQWGNIKESSGGNVDFVKLTSGKEGNMMRVVGLPSEIDLHWEDGVDGSKKKVLCPGAGCPICAAGKTPQRRYQVKVIDKSNYDYKNKKYDGDGVQIKVLEQGPQVFNAIKDFAMEEMYGDPTKYDIKIKKEGTGRDTRYSIVASPNKVDLTEEEQAAVDASKSLAEINKPKTADEIKALGLAVLVEKNGFDFDSEEDKSDEPTKTSDDDWENL